MQSYERRRRAQETFLACANPDTSHRCAICDSVLGNRDEMEEDFGYWHVLYGSDVNGVRVICDACEDGPRAFAGDAWEEAQR